MTQPPQPLFKQFVFAQVSYHPDETQTGPDAPVYEILNFGRFPETAEIIKRGSLNEEESELLKAALSFLVPVTNPWGGKSKQFFNSSDKGEGGNANSKPSNELGADWIFHDVLLTDEVGQRLFGTTLTVKDMVLVDNKLITNLKENNQLDPLTAKVTSNRGSLAACFSLYSATPAYATNRHCLYELAKMLSNEQREIGDAEKFIWWLLHEVTLPPTGSLGAKIELSVSKTVLTFGPYSQPIIPRPDVSLLPLFQCLGFGNIISVLAQLLLEQPILLISDSFSLLGSVAEGLMTLLYPFSWIGVYVPSIPSASIELLEAPGGYIFGTLTKDYEYKAQDIPKEAMRVFLDRDLILARNSDIEFLPGFTQLVDQIHALFHPFFAHTQRGTVTRPIISGTFADQDQRVQPVSNKFSTILTAHHIDPALEREFNQEIRKLFAEYYHDYLLKNFRKYFTLEGGEFDIEAFTAKFSESDKNFIQKFAPTNLFTEFISEYGPKTPVDEFDYFDSLIAPQKIDNSNQYTIAFGSAESSDAFKEINFRSFQELSPGIKKTDFRLDLFYHFRTLSVNPFQGLVKRLKTEINQNRTPRQQEQIKWMIARQLHSYGEFEAALERYSQIITDPIVNKEVLAILERLSKDKRKALVTNPRTPKPLLPLINSFDRKKARRALSTQDDFSDEEDSSTPSDKDKLLLNEREQGQELIEQALQSPLKLASDALELIKQFYQLFTEVRGTDLVFRDKANFVHIVKLNSFQRFKFVTSHFAKVKLDSMQNMEKLCFFLNVRSCLLLHAFVEYGVPFAISQRIALFQKVCYNVAGFELSLNELTHAIIRSSLYLPEILGQASNKKNKIPDDDPKAFLRTQIHEPLINFILFEGNASFPFVTTFQPSDLRGQLTGLAQLYCDRFIGIDYKKKLVYIPRGLMWYVTDFGKTEKDILTFICSRLPDTILAKYLASQQGPKNQNQFKGITVKFIDYSWDFAVVFPDSHREVTK